MQTIDITEVKKDIFSLADRLKKSAAPLLVVNSFGSNFVVISEDEWNNIQETLSLASIPGYGETIAKDRKEDYSKKKPYTKSIDAL